MSAVRLALCWKGFVQSLFLKKDISLVKDSYSLVWWMVVSDPKYGIIFIWNTWVKSWPPSPSLPGCRRRYCRTGARELARTWRQTLRIERQKLRSFCQFWLDYSLIAIRHSLNVPYQCPTSKIWLQLSFGHRYVKDHEEEGGRQVDEPGDHEGVWIFS